jgi:trimethylamine--corrinoid protein Co-methyltransferase
MMEVQRPTVTILSKTAIERIMDEAMGLLEDTGIIVEEEETLDILNQMGGEVDAKTGRLKIKRKTTEKAIESAPKELEMHSLSGAWKFGFCDDQIHFNPGSAALFIYDAQKSVMRPPTVGDAAKFTKLCHTLDNIEAVSTGVIPADVPKDVSDSIRLYLSCLFSDKPVVTGTFSEPSFDMMRDLLLARAGTDSLRDKPCAIFDVCPTSPLRWSHIGCHDLRCCAQSAIPAQLISMPLAGALAPVSLLASVVQHAAETLSGIVIHQAWTPGSPIIWGGSPALFDMRHSTSPMGAVETLLIDIAYAEVGKSLGLPTQAYLGMSDSKTLDAQAGMETAMTVIMAAAGAVDFVSGPGMLNFESCQSLEKLVLDNEICGMARRFKRGMETWGETMGRHAILEGLADGYYLTAPETLRLYKAEAYYPSSVIDRKAFKDEGAVPAARLVEEAGRQIEERLEAYQQPEIPAARIEDMKSVMERALSPHGVQDLAAKCLDL